MLWWIMSTSPPKLKPSPRVDALMLRLHRYLGSPKAERGVKAELARYLGARPHMLSDWLAGGGRPNAEYALGIQEWLDERGG